MEVLKAARSILCTGLGQDLNHLSTWLIVIARDSVGDSHYGCLRHLLPLVTNCLKLVCSSHHPPAPFTRRFTLQFILPFTSRGLRFAYPQNFFAMG
jgi:hypothetical protein